MSQFLSSFGPKIVGGEVYDPSDDIIDQRAPVNDPEALYENFVVPDDIMDELDAETLDDFDDDIYPYEDRTDYGVDIAAAANLDLKKSRDKIKKMKEKQKALDEQDKVNKDEDKA